MYLQYLTIRDDSGHGTNSVEFGCRIYIYEVRLRNFSDERYFDIPIYNIYELMYSIQVDCVNACCYHIWNIDKPEYNNVNNRSQISKLSINTSSNGQLGLNYNQFNIKINL